MKPYYVLLWDFNGKKTEKYDVMPYFQSAWEKLPKSKRPKTFEEVKQWLKDRAIYQFWSRCEYEMICSSWPPSKNENEKEKIDAYDQIEMNLDVITKFFMEEIYGH